MPMKNLLRGHVDRADPWMLFCAKCSQKMKMTRSTPAQEGRETRTYECACGHSERINLALHQGKSQNDNIATFQQRYPSSQNAHGQQLQGASRDGRARFAVPAQRSSTNASSPPRPEGEPELSTIPPTEDRADPLQFSVRDAMLAAVPRLRAFAISLSGNVDRADDLVQETLLRAISNVNSFRPGTNMSAWLFTILRNVFRSDYRKRRREVEDTDGSHTDGLKSPPPQQSRVEFEELRVALAKVEPDQREALLLIGASGFSYVEVATICGIAVGTVKSRVHRARARLSQLLALDAADTFGPDIRWASF